MTLKNKKCKLTKLKGENMKVFYNNVVTFINNMSPFLKTLIIGLLIIIDVLCVVQIIKTAGSSKKMLSKIGQYLLLALFLALTMFVTLHV